MAAIAPKLFLTLALAGAAFAADAREEISNELANIAADFSSANADGILKRVSSTLPERNTLEDNLRAMLHLALVSTSIEVREFTAAGARATVSLDWYLEMRRNGEGSLLATQRRREVIHTVWEKQGKRWKIVELKPLAFFAPPASQ